MIELFLFTKTDIIIVVLFLIILLFCLPIVALITCKQVTGTYNINSFLFNNEYWSFSIMNHEFKNAKEQGMSTNAFLRKFFYRHLSSNLKRKARSKHYNLLFQIMATPDFIEQNFGIEKYSLEVHEIILDKWFELTAGDNMPTTSEE